MFNKESGFTPILIIFLLIVVGLIGVGAYYLTKVNSSKPVVVVQTPKTQTSASPSASIDPTNNWKTYENVTHGYEIKYPQNYQINENKQNDWVQFYLSKDGKVNNFEESVMISQKASKDVNLCDKKIDGYPNAYCFQLNDMTFLNWKSEDVNSLGPLNFVYNIYNKGLLYQIQFLGIQASKKDQILSTFRFTDQSQNLDTSNWKIYTDTLMGYKISYPPTWETQYTDYSQSVGGHPVDALIIKDTQSNSLLEVTGNGQRAGCRADMPNAITDCHEMITIFRNASGLMGYKAAFDQNNPDIIGQYTFKTGKNPDFGKNYIEIGTENLSDPQLPIELRMINTISEL